MKIPFLPLIQKIRTLFSWERALAFWYRHYKILFLFLFFAVLLLGGWHWYDSLYRYRLSDEEKRQYVERYFQETTFKEGKFLDTTEALERRARMHDTAVRIERDIFKGTGIQVRE